MTPFITHGILTLSNHGGFEIELSNDGDSARLKYYDKVSNWQTIKYTFNGDPYVTYYGRRYKLNKFMKI